MGTATTPTPAHRFTSSRSSADTLVLQLEHSSRHVLPPLQYCPMHQTYFIDTCTSLPAALVIRCTCAVLPQPVENLGIDRCRRVCASACLFSLCITARQGTAVLSVLVDPMSWPHVREGRNPTFCLARYDLLCADCACADSTVCCLQAR